MDPLQLLAKLLPYFKTDVQNTLFLHKKGIQTLQAHSSHDSVNTLQRGTTQIQSSADKEVRIDFNLWKSIGDANF